MKAFFIGPLAAVFLLLTACGQDSSPEVELAGDLDIADPVFALTSANIIENSSAIVTEEKEFWYPVSLPFVAPTEHPIWEHLASVGLSSPADAEIIDTEISQGEQVADNAYLGTLSFEMQVPEEGIKFDEIEVNYLVPDEPVYHAKVGTWRIDVLPEENFMKTDQEVRLTSVCEALQSDVSLDVPTNYELVIGSDDISVVMTELVEPGLVDTALRCGDSYDFYIVTPQFTYLDEAGNQQQLYVAPVNIGGTAISQEQVQAIAARGN